MIIYIDKSIAIRGRENGLTEDERFLYQKLILANKSGNCLLCGDLNSLKWLSETLGDDFSELYLKLSNYYSESRSIIDAVETLVVITQEDSAIIPSFIKGKCRQIKVNDAMRINLDQRCSLVGENLTDCAFYQMMGYRYYKDHGINGIKLSFREELGGGDTMHTVFEKCIVRDGVLTLCIMDSDIKYDESKKYPQKPEPGETAKKLMQKSEELQKTALLPTFSYLCIPVHEAENLIPFSVLEKVSADVPDMVNGVVYLKKILAANQSSSILLYDFKEGGKKAHDPRPKYEPLRSYWKEITDKIDDDSMPQLCGKVLDKAVSELEKVDEDGNAFIVSVPIDSYLTEIWKTIGLSVFSWGCASDPVRS